MPLQLLLISKDTTMAGSFGLLSRKLRLALTTCEQPEEAPSMLAQQRFDIIAVDCDDLYDGIRFLKSARSAPPNRSATVLAILNGHTPAADALDLGAHVTISKPIASAFLQASLLNQCRALDQRRYMRVPLRVPVYVSFGEVTDRLATAFNISEGGMGLFCEHPIDDTEILRVKFQLPETRALVLARGEVAWVDARGNTGIRFLSVHNGAQELRGWVQTRMPLANARA
jgi:DNA-binding response OmpR family regulator